MTILPPLVPATARSARWWNVLARYTVSLVAVVGDVSVIVAVSVLVGLGYHLEVYRAVGPVPGFVALGTSAASIFVLPGIFRGEYELTHYLSFRQHATRAFAYWNITFVALLVLAFVTRALEDYSRASMILFYLAGFPTLVLMRYALVSTVILGSRAGIVTAQRVFLIGASDDITAFVRRYQPWNLGLHTVGAAPLSPIDPLASREERAQTLATDLRGALDSARRLHPEAVYVVGPWSETATIEACVDEFLKMPVEIHLGPERVLDRFDNVRIAKHGSMASLQLTRAPLNASERMLKRIFDVTAASGILIALAPLFGVTALLIFLESGRPIFFRQRRYGFNQQEFRIIKFRTMTTMEDGDVVPQARRNDPRVTPLGRFLRKWNVDELPQLINVLKGDMSLVGPRPHALSHNREYERKIALYARRHNVLPGITGWAQVKGFRGETDTDDKMQRRVECDLHYIDNWSLWLDLRILFLTLLSGGE